MMKLNESGVREGLSYYEVLTIKYWVEAKVGFWTTTYSRIQKVKREKERRVKVTVISRRRSENVVSVARKTMTWFCRYLQSYGDFWCFAFLFLGVNFLI